MGAENLVPSRHPNRFGSVRCHVPKSARTTENMSLETNRKWLCPEKVTKSE